MKFPSSVRTPEEALIELLFHFSILMEYQLLDLQHSVRDFVSRMSNAVTVLDGITTEESRTAGALLARLDQGAGSDDSMLGHDGVQKETGTVSVGDVSVGDVRAQLVRMKELDERLRPSLYTIIECLNFEDIQSQRIEHLVNSFKLLNQGIMEKLETGLANQQREDILAFARRMANLTRAMYTMPEERDIFDQVFRGSFEKLA